jgi:ketosteroid isomerase-like protein
MKNILFFAVLICTALTAPRLSAQDLNTEMTALGNAWKAALERGDATAIAALYSEKVIYVNSKDGSETTRTRAEIEADMKKTLEAKTGTLEFAPGSTSTLLPDGKASIKGEFTQTMTDKKTGEKQVFNGIFDHQTVKENGQWKFCLVKVTRKE